MGLNLTGVAISSPRMKAQLQSALDILADIQEQVKAMGLPEYPKPSTAPTPLSDLNIGDLVNRDLETYMTAYVAYAAYVEQKLAEAEAAYKISTHTLKTLRANLKVSLFADNIPKGEVDARVSSSPEYMELELEHLKLSATREILTAHYKGYSKQASALSRVIELRKLEFEQEHRAHNVGNFRPRRPGSPQGGLPKELRRK